MKETTITLKKLEANRVPDGREPAFKDNLEDNERYLGVQYHFEKDYSSRKTTDHTLWVWVASEE